jgi:hypothetical protein
MRMFLISALRHFWYEGCFDARFVDKAGRY